MSTTLAVIGGGNMAKAIVDGAIAGGILQCGDIAVADPDEQCRAYFDDLGCTTAPLASGLPTAPFTLLAVKPQVFDVVAPSVASEVVYSIMAGVTTRRISDAIPNARTVRIMPNLPCCVRYGAAGIALGETATEEDAELARQLFGAIGIVVDVKEELMDAVTAVSGSGPAYVFLLAEAMIEGGMKAGLDEEAATALVGQTLRGAAEMLVQDSRTATQLREAVTSKGGTTAAALAMFQDRDVHSAIADAVIAARDRGAELGNG